MSNVGSIYGANGNGAFQFGGGVDTANLTPDALLAYCQAQLGGLDGQITDYENAQKAQLAEKAAIQNAEVVFKQFGSKGPQNQEQWDKCENALSDAANSLPAGDPVRQQLLDYKTSLEKQYCKGVSDNPHYPGDGEWQGNCDALDNMANHVSSEAELQMIELQSLVSQRATAIQLTTNLMSTMNQSTKDVVSKIGS
jgi:hypothetical protein